MKLQIYGDSLMKAITVDENYKYRPTAKDRLARLEADTGIVITNRAHFGYTTTRGQAVLAKDLSRGLDCQAALLEFGGNDCDFHWPSVAADPEAEHLPNTPLLQFLENLKTMALSLKDRGIQPFLMTLPPLDAEKYLNFIGRLGSDTTAILRWLGDVQTIYRWQELYSNAITRLAAELRLPLIDIRTHFLTRRDCQSLIARDGIHLTPQGYDLLFQQIVPCICAV